MRISTWWRRSAGRSRRRSAPAEQRMTHALEDARLARRLDEQELREPAGLRLVDRDRGLGLAALVPDAEADVPLRRCSRQVAGNPERTAPLALDVDVRMEELRQLGLLLPAAPGAVVKRL